jgi:2-polyprenyl-3-methyl-5-hydroxy-6-metoxy-1,4-benzoquinol methylase
MSRPEAQAPAEIVSNIPIDSQVIFPDSLSSIMATRRLKSIHQSEHQLFHRRSIIPCSSLTVIVSSSTRIQRIQAEMTNRAIELLALPPNESLFLLDIGCGSGLSGEILDDLGHVWAGVDIAPSMLREYTSHFERPSYVRDDAL